jgi:hypothetical protein
MALGSGHRIGGGRGNTHRAGGRCVHLKEWVPSIRITLCMLAHIQPKADGLG